MKKFRTIMQFAKHSGGVLVWENDGYTLYKPSTPLCEIISAGKEIIKYFKK